MTRKITRILVAGLMVLLPAAAFGADRRQARDTMTCLPLPVSTDAKDVHVGGQHYHVAGRNDAKVCITLNHSVQGTPTVTQYNNCGNICFAARVADIRAYKDMKVELTYKEDGQAESIVIDPDPVDLTRDTEEVCVSNHSAGTPDPCVVNITSPSDLRARGGDRQVSLRWAPAGESYDRPVEMTYEVWRNTSDDLETFEQIATVTGTRFLDTGLEKETSYWYFVVAVDENGNRSGGSNLATATTN